MPTVKMKDGSDYDVKTLLGKGDSNIKLAKSDASGLGYLTVGLSLAPARESGYEVCASRSPGCTKSCLFTSGMGNIPNVVKARIAKTILFFEENATFWDMLVRELHTAVKRANKQNKILACRLNVLSDIMWENQFPKIFTDFPMVQFYDYTKHIKRMSTKLPKNYHLTFSKSEKNDLHCLEVLANGGNVTVVFADKLPATYWGYRVINGDETDLRFIDDKNVIVGLKAKGRAKKDTTGFVINRFSLPVV